MFGGWLLTHTKTDPKFPLGAVTAYFSFTTAAWADCSFMKEAQTKEKSPEITQLTSNYTKVPFAMEQNYWSEKHNRQLNQIVADPDVGCCFHFSPDVGILFY